MSTDESRRPEPVFVLAPARSYSTVTVALLAGHPAIYGFPELLLFGVRAAGDLLTEEQRSPYLDPGYVEVRQTGPLRALAELHEGDQSAAAIARARDWLRAHADWPVKDVFDHLLDLVAPRIGLEKSPDTIATQATIEACLRTYPRARLLHLTRHPVTTQLSMHRHWQNMRHIQNRRHLVAAAASAWYLGHNRAIRALEALPPDQWLRVAAEDLLGQPLVWLPKILDWLGLGYDHEQIGRMLHTERWVYAGHGDMGNLYGGDAVFLGSPKLRPAIDPGPVVFDPAWGLPAEMIRRMTELARYLGYAIGDDE
jgi:hypothetical protein